MTIYVVAPFVVPFLMSKTARQNIWFRPAVGLLVAPRNDGVRSTLGPQTLKRVAHLYSSSADSL